MRELKGGAGRDEWLFLRATQTGDRLDLSVVKDDTLKDLSEREALRQIKARIRDEALYERWAVCMSQK